MFVRFNAKTIIPSIAYWLDLFTLWQGVARYRGEEGGKEGVNRILGRAV